MFSGKLVQYFSISVNDNNSYMCASTDKILENVSGLEICLECGYRINFEFVNPNFDIENGSFDLSSTYDGYYIASLKFKEAIERAKIEGVNFVPLEQNQNYYVMFVQNRVEFDTEKRHSRSENYCTKCGNFESFVGATPAFLKSIPKGHLCRTDIVFGSGNSKHPLLIANEEFVSLVKREKLKGLYFEATRT